MRYIIYAISGLTLLVFLSFIFVEFNCILDMDTPTYHYLLYGFILFPAIFISNIIRTIVSYMHFKQLTVFCVLPYVFNALILILLFQLNDLEIYTPYVLIFSSLISVSVEVFLIREVRDGNQIGVVL